MSKVKIAKEEFEKRLEKIRKAMDAEGIDLLLVYGDEYRKENLRYVSNFWPIFEQGALLVGKGGQPILLCAPEGEQVAREMSVWENVRLVPDFACVTVDETIDYPWAEYITFQDLASQYGPLGKLGICGIDAMPMHIYKAIEKAFGCDIVDANKILSELRRTKSAGEIACLTEAARIADEGMRAIMNADLIGLTELQACAIAEQKAREEGAEHIIFTVFGSGERTNTIIGRPTEKIIEDGDMIMISLAVQYEGYVATCEAPFAVGNADAETIRVIDTLIRASNAGLPYLKAGEPMKNFVRAVRDYFREAGLSEYDVYPPLHGIGCAEAESPYPDEDTEAVFEEGMTFNTDISLFGLPGGSNRIEEGFRITENGAQTLSPYVREYCLNWLSNH